MPYTAKQERFFHARNIPHKHDYKTRPPIKKKKKKSKKK